PINEISTSWQAYSNEFLILSNIARDYLIIQATSITLEQAFLITENVITKLPEISRACLCVKSWMDKNLVN
ncbi:14563_t:CDS:2, partial [Funneliformis mosseae]